MKFMSGYLDDAYASFLESPVACCSPTRKEFVPARGGSGVPTQNQMGSNRVLSGIEKPMRIEHHQPRLVPSPIFEPQDRPTTRGREWATRSRTFASRASSRGSFAVKRQLNAYNGYQRRPQIGAPSNFRHLEHALPRRTEVFRPLELSIYMPENQLSPILPHFGNIDDVSYGPQEKALPFPPTAVIQTRSESALSHRIPRKPLRADSRASVEWSSQYRQRPESNDTQELLASGETQLPLPPPPARLRAMTEPPTYERVKSALHEKYELEERLKQIEETIEERKSIYMNSRPTSRATSRASRISRPVSSIYEESQEPMPTPPVAPSFAERVASPHFDQRPKTAPTKTVHIPVRLKSFTEASATFTTPSPPALNYSRPDKSLPMPPPPLPLTLKSGPHPPLRKKKSFSRVSNWLFPSEHSRNTSLDSITNTPKPVTSRDGFYQCVELREKQARTSIDSASTVSTLESELDEPTPPSGWTPDSSPGRDRIEKSEPVTIRTFSLDTERNEKSIELTRVRTFGEKDMGDDEKWRMHVDTLPYVPPGRNSVGVAF